MQHISATREVNLHEICTTFAHLPRVLRLIWHASPALVAGMACIMLLEGITPLAHVIIARLLIDGALQGIARGTIQPLVLPVVLQLGVNLLNRLCLRVYATLQILLNHRLSNHITLLILRKASTLDLAFFENAEFYDRLTHMRQEVMSKPLLMIVKLFNLGSSLVITLSLLGLLFQLSWWLALLALLVPLPAFLADSRHGLKNYWVTLWQSPRRRQQHYITELLTTDTYTKEIKLFNLADFFTRRYATLSEHMYQEDRQLQARHIRISVLWSIAPALANAALYLYVALQTIGRRISLGALTQYALAINEVGQNFQSMLDSLSELYEHHLFINTLFAFLAYEPQIVAPAHPAPVEIPADSTGLDIEFRNVSFTYPGKSEPVLKDISFILHAGESVALVGCNGAGKTTLLKLLARLYDPDTGDILIGGRNLKEYDPCALREQIGVIFQDYIRYRMTAGENIGIGRVTEIENRVLVDLAARKSGVDGIIAGLDKSYDTMLGRWFEQGMDLSGGEWQKIALARAFMRNAPVLVLDEPTSALDAQAEYDIFQRFRQLTADCTVIFVSHRFSTVRLADRIFVLEQGHIIESGSHWELLDLGGQYAELFNLQAQAYR
ncbi:MAG TPA: ABC transporter ATP-binding protein [Ktedonobacteraceae bacterium]|jgi:ATP-binding cassette subfamily B protein